MNNSKDMPSEKRLVFIPTYNCEKQISRVLERFKGNENFFAEILILDNGSTDETINVATAAAESLNIQVHIGRNNMNYGLGGSHKVAFKYAIEKSFDYCIVLHGDDQADIRDLIPYLSSGEHKNYDCFLGARFMPGAKLQGYSFIRTMGNQIFNIIFSILTFSKVYDLGSGLNMYKTEKLPSYLFLDLPDGLVFNYHLLLQINNTDSSIKFFPISWREFDQISNVRIIKQTTTLLSLCLKFLVSKKQLLESKRNDFEDYSFSEVNAQEDSRATV